MTTIKVTSSHRPALFSGQTHNRIIAGTITEVNGKPWPHPYIGVDKRITLQNIEWTSSVARPVQAAQPSVVKVRGSKGNVYTVTTLGNGTKTCNCPGFTYRRFCKHTGNK